ncbi:MAG TPA: hypothetical protein ENH99_01620 [Candidatus Pacearchaeota archaeon]|nr:hypothetical protein [Candidatus Pacearchaeota archaeon]
MTKKLSKLETLEDGRTVKTYSEEELKYIKEKQRKKKISKSLKKTHKKYPRGSRGRRSLSGYSERLYGGTILMEITKLKKGHEPWPEQQKKIMQLGVDQLIQKRDSMRQELMTEKTGLNEMDKEVQTNIDQAAMAVKAANMSLASLLFDQKYEITIGKHKNRVVELEQEIATHEHNINHFQIQLAEGRPVRNPTKSPKKDLDISQEDADKIKKEQPQRELSEEEFKKLKKEKGVGKHA